MQTDQTVYTTKSNLESQGVNQTEMISEVEETEEYPLNYIVNIYNPKDCTFNIKQTGKPSGGTPPPGGS